jgi:hypothetical protein
MLKISVIALLLCMLPACSSTYRLSPDDIKWNPYKGGEVLVFQSNNGNTDTLFVKEVETAKTPTDNLALFPNHREILNVVVTHTRPIPFNTEERMEDSFFELYGTKDKNTLINFQFKARNAWFYSESYYKKDLEKSAALQLTTKNAVYFDVIKLEPASKEYADRNEFVTALYWSRSKGYVRFDLKNNVYWELQ